MFVKRNDKLTIKVVIRAVGLNIYLNGFHLNIKYLILVVVPIMMEIGSLPHTGRNLPFI